MQYHDFKTVSDIDVDQIMRQAEQERAEALASWVVAAKNWLLHRRFSLRSA